MKKTKPFITDQQHIQSINRKLLSLMLFAFVFIFTVAFFSTFAAGQEPLSIKVGAYANHPKIFMDVDGKVSGFWPDFIEHIAKTENWKIEYIWGTWSEGLDHLINKEIAIMPDVAFTEKRNKLYTFSETPVLMSWTRLYINKENTEIQSIRDLKNKKIAALKGSVNLEGSGGLREIALGFNLNCAFSELDNYTEVFKAVEENRVDAGITNRNFGNKNAKNFKVKKTPIIFQPINIKFAFPKDAELTPHLAERINYHIKKLKQDEHSVYYRLLEKYFEAEIAEKTVEVFPGWLSTVLKSITALFIFFILVIIVSRIQVKRKTNEIMVKNEALQISEQRYREIYNSPSDAIFIHDASTGKILDVNRAILDMYGYDREEALQLEIGDISSEKHTYTQDQAGELINKAIIDGPQTFEWQARKKNGESFWVEVALKYSEIRDAGYVIAVVRDISQRKQAEEALRFERDNLHNIFEAIEDGIYIVNRQYDIQYVNPVLVKEFGPYEGVKCYRYFHDRDEACPWCKNQDVQAGKTVQWEWYSSKNGKTYDLLDTPMTLPDGSTGKLEIFRDISDRKQMEEELRKSEEKHRLLADNTIDCVWKMNFDLEFTYINQAVFPFSGYTPEEWIESKLPEHCSSEEMEKMQSIIADSLDNLPNKTTEVFETTFYHKNGKEIPCELSAKIVLDDAGNPIYIQGATRDITERKNLEAQLRQAQKMEAIGTLTGGIAHDFNNLLTAIIGNAEIALMDVIKDESLRRGIEEIKKAGNKAASLTRQLLAFSRKQVIKPEVLDLNEVINETEKMLKRMIGEDIEFQTILKPELWKVHMDSGQIDQMIINIAVNARDAMTKGGKLIIETTNVDLDKNYLSEHGIEGPPGHYVMLAISDTGSGMDKETREHIFEPFFTTKEIGKGTGLGLSTVYGIVKQNNGFIWAYSEPGHGTTFKVYLPKVKEGVKPEEKEQTPVGDLNGSETVLIVEDDDRLRNLTRKILERYGYSTLEAENGEDALRVSEEYEGSIQLMVTDVVMPKMSGKEVAERLQSLRPEIKMIYMSGYTDNAIVHHGVLVPGINFLEKPFTPEGLARKVREVLDK